MRQKYRIDTVDSKDNWKTITFTDDLEIACHICNTRGDDVAAFVIDDEGNTLYEKPRRSDE